MAASTAGVQRTGARPLPGLRRRTEAARALAQLMSGGSGAPSEQLLRALDRRRDAEVPPPTAAVWRAVMVLTAQPQRRRPGSLAGHVRTIEALAKFGTTDAVCAFRDDDGTRRHPMQPWTVAYSTNRRLLHRVPQLLVDGFSHNSAVVQRCAQIPQPLVHTALSLWAPFDDGPLASFTVAAATAALLH